MNDIAFFLKQEPKDYLQGAQLYVKYGKNKNLIKSFLNKPDSTYNKGKIVYELQRLHDEGKGSKIAAKATTAPVKASRSKQAVTPPSSDGSIIEQLLNNRHAYAKALLKERDFLFNTQLGDEVAEETREYAALRVKDISVNVLEEVYDDIDQLKKGVNPYDELTDTQLEGKYRNAQKNLSKARTKEQKVNMLRWEAKCEWFKLLKEYRLSLT